MTLKLYRLTLPEDLRSLAQIARTKGAKVSISTSGDLTIVTCRAYGRLLGELRVLKTLDGAEIVEQRIVEKDFYPYELMLVSLVSALKKRKTKYLKT